MSQVEILEASITDGTDHQEPESEGENEHDHFGVDEIQVKISYRRSSDEIGRHGNRETNEVAFRRGIVRHCVEAGEPKRAARRKKESSCKEVV